MLYTERTKLQELIAKIQGFLRGFPAEHIIESMTSISLQLARATTDRDTAESDLNALEAKFDQNDQTSANTDAYRLKSLRQAVG